MAYRTVLEPAELALADWIAGERNVLSSSRGDAPAHGATSNGDAAEALRVNVVGARGEVAVARLLELFPNLSTYHQEKRRAGGFDLAHRICVRAAAKRFGLLVRPADPDEGRYVAVVVREREVLVLGWMGGWEAKDDVYRAAPGGRPPCFLVPEAELWPMDDLRYVIAEERLDVDRMR